MDEVSILLLASLIGPPIAGAVAGVLVMAFGRRAKPIRRWH